MDRASLSAPSSRRVEGGGTVSVTLSPSLQNTCALLCGYLATGLVPEGGLALLRLVATWLLADATYGHVFAQLAAMRVCVASHAARSALQGSASNDPPGSSLRIAAPHPTTASPSERLTGWFERRVNGHPSQSPPQALTCGLAALVTSGLALVIATYLGRETLALAGLGLLLASCVMVFSGRNIHVTERWFAGLHVALAWQLGYVISGSWSNLALAIAALMGLGTWARTRLVQGDSLVARWLAAAIQVIWVVLLLVRGQPVLATWLAILALGERIARPPLRGHLAWLLSMALIALGVRYWN